MTAPILVTSPLLPPLEEFIPYLEEIWASRFLTNGGSMHQALEQALCDYLGVQHISLFANGTLALLTALQSLRVTGEVITTPYSFVATTHALSWNGLRPVFADIDPVTLNLDPEKIEAAITPRTTAIMPVHCYGNPCAVAEIQRICDKYGVLIISDEVICGFGRLGTWFGCETMGFKPDLITFAKGVTSGYIPLGGVLVGDRVAKVLIEEGGEFNHGYTYSGHPVACEVAMANIKLMQEHDIVNQVKNDTAPYLKEKFESLNDHPLVADARTLGLVGGFELLKNKETGERFDESIAVGMICRGHCFGNGLVMRAVGDRMIIAPPLVISHAEIDELVDLARKALDATLADLKQKNL